MWNFPIRILARSKADSSIHCVDNFELKATPPTTVRTRQLAYGTYLRFFSTSRIYLHTLHLLLACALKTCDGMWVD